MVGNGVVIFGASWVVFTSGALYCNPSNLAAMSSSVALISAIRELLSVAAGVPNRTEHVGVAKAKKMKNEQRSDFMHRIDFLDQSTIESPEVSELPKINSSANDFSFSVSVK